MRGKIIKFANKYKIYLIIAANFAIFSSILFTIFGQAIRNPNSVYIGIEGDSSYYIWITKWFSQFWTHPDILHITNVFYPIGIDISAGWEGSILFYVGGFFNLLFSEPAAYNLLILVPFLLNWTALYFVFNKFSGRLFFSGVFATLFCTSSFFMVRSLGHPSYLYFFHIPLLFYFLQYDWLKNLNLKKSLLLVAIYVLISITSWYYFIFAVIITAIYLIQLIIKKRKFGFFAYKKIALTYIAVICAVILFNFPMFKAFLLGSDYFYPYPSRMNNTEHNRLNSMLAVDYLRPSTLNLFYAIPPHWRIGNIEKNLFPGISFFILLAISIFYVFKRKKYRDYYALALVAILFFVISLGYNSAIPLYKWLNSLPIVSTLHAPSRFGIVVILVGWLIIAKSGKYMKSSAITAILILLMAFQLYETKFFAVPFQNFDDMRILSSLESADKSPILEIPIQPNKSSSLLIPGLSGRSVFSGYPQHTTYSPKLENIIASNALNYLGDTYKDSGDIAETLTPAETAYYLTEKFGLENIVVNKRFSLDEKAKELLGYFDLVSENDSYAIYKINQNLLSKNLDEVKIVTGIGVGKSLKGERKLSEKSDFDILNLTGKDQKLKLSFNIEPLINDTEYSISGKELKTDFEIIAKPGIGTFTLKSNKKCTVRGAECITGTISGISMEMI